MSTVSSSNPEFCGWRSYLWPVHRWEYRKLIPMLFLFFFVALNYNILRTLKDTLLVTAKDSGAEVIPFVKVWAMFPGAILMTWAYSRLSRRLSPEKVFYFFMTVFLGYFFLFAFVLFPMRDTLHPHQLADHLQTILPAGCKGFIAMFRYWSFTVFYTMSELWGTMILFVLLWGFANQVTSFHEAKRFYAILGIGANCSGIFAGQLSVFLCRPEIASFSPFGHTPWEKSLNLIIGLILLSGLLSTFFYRWLHKNVLPKEPVQTAQVEQEKPSFRKNFRYLFSSKYLLSIAMIVIAYNMVINLTEVLWKHQVKEVYPNPADYTLYMNEIVSIVGVIATVTSIFISGNAIRKLGWTFTALMTPVILLLTSVGFFTFFFLKQGSPLPLFGFDPMLLALFWGSLQNVMSRAAKYTVFDETKEMSFIPLDSQARVMGKAAIDGVCSRLGKSGGSFIYQGLLLVCASVASSAPYVAGTLFVIILFWMGATKFLGKQFFQLTQQTAPPEPQPAKAYPTFQEQEPVQI